MRGPGGVSLFHRDLVAIHVLFVEVYYHLPGSIPSFFFGLLLSPFHIDWPVLLVLDKILGGLQHIAPAFG